jgi:hypothetical protein
LERLEPLEPSAQKVPTVPIVPTVQAVACCLMPSSIPRIPQQLLTFIELFTFFGGFDLQAALTSA